MGESTVFVIVSQTNFPIVVCRTLDIAVREVGRLVAEGIKSSVDTYRIVEVVEAAP